MCYNFHNRHINAFLCHKCIKYCLSCIICKCNSNNKSNAYICNSCVIYRGICFNCYGNLGIYYHRVKVCDGCNNLRCCSPSKKK